MVTSLNDCTLSSFRLLMFLLLPVFSMKFWDANQTEFSSNLDTKLLLSTLFTSSNTLRGKFFQSVKGISFSEVYIFVLFTSKGIQ